MFGKILCQIKRTSNSIVLVEIFHRIKTIVSLKNIEIVRV